jgi:DNA polymerase-1
MANIPSKDSKYHDPELKELASYWGEKMRSVWQAEPGKVVVGVDASGIQLRVLAHYMNDEDFSTALVQGQSEDGTDVHSLNRDKLGLGPDDRPRAKTFIYAWLLGAGTPKISSILNLVAKAAKAAVEKFINGYPGLKALKEGRIKKDAHRGFFQAIDGRYIAQEQERLILAGYLQSGEACVMKHSLMRWYEKLTEMGLPFLVVNFVHDEWVTETPPEHAKKVKALQIEAIEETGKKLGFNIELTGAGDIGNNWYEVH